MRLPALLRRSRQVIFFLRFANKFKISPRYGGIRTPGEILRWGSRSVAIFSELVHATELQLCVNTPKPGMSVEKPLPLKLRTTYLEGMALLGKFGVGITNPTLECLNSAFPLTNGYAKNGLAVRIWILS